MPFELNVRTFYLLLGNNCNFSCRYCIQEENTNNKVVCLPKTISPYTINFIKKVAKHSKYAPEIIFYGGEPLIYYSKIKELVEKLESSRVSYSIITNGSLITEEIVEFFNKYNVKLIVSWDGARSLDTRKVNIFADEKSKSIIFKSNKFSINSVISASNYPYEACEDIQTLANEYKVANPQGDFSVNFDEIIDNNLHDRGLLEMDYRRVENDVVKIVDECREYLGEKLIYISFNDFNYVKYNFLYRYLCLIEKIKKNGQRSKYISPCGDGLERIGIDLAGNLYSCHDSREIIGNVASLDLINYVANYIKYDNTKQLYETLCKDCRYYPICQTRCKLLTIGARKNHTCKLKEAIGRPLLDYFETKGVQNGFQKY